VALQQATVVTVLVLVSITEAIRRSAFFDLGLALALLAPAGGLLFARFLERWE
jgi:multisubunit Na+/H+ antiporter MnhF subunit